MSIEELARKVLAGEMKLDNIPADQRELVEKKIDELSYGENEIAGGEW